MVSVLSSLCPTGIPKIVGKCRWVHKKDMQCFVSGLHKVGSPTGRKEASLLCSAFFAPSFMLLITKGYTQLLLKLPLLHHWLFLKFSVHSCTYLPGSPNSLDHHLHAKHLQALPGIAALHYFPQAALQIHPHDLPIFQAHKGQVSDNCHYCIWLTIFTPQFLNTIFTKICLPI